jgi:hypothetical protein
MAKNDRTKRRREPLLGSTLFILCPAAPGEYGLAVDVGGKKGRAMFAFTTREIAEKFVKNVNVFPHIKIESMQLAECAQLLRWNLKHGVPGLYFNPSPTRDGGLGGFYVKAEKFLAVESVS